jgi:hypothetical protein
MVTTNNKPRLSIRVFQQLHLIVERSRDALLAIAPEPHSRYWWLGILERGGFGFRPAQRVASVLGQGSAYKITNINVPAPRSMTSLIRTSRTGPRQTRRTAPPPALHSSLIERMPRRRCQLRVRNPQAARSWEAFFGVPPALQRAPKGVQGIHRVILQPALLRYCLLLTVRAHVSQVPFPLQQFGLKLASNSKSAAL